MDEMPIELIQAILSQNKDVPFVRRIQDRYIYPVLDNQNGTISTHSMADSERDGKGYAYPTVVSDNQNGLKRLADALFYRPDMPFNKAMKSGNYIEFDNPQQANSFARNYKKVWK